MKNTFRNLSRRKRFRRIFAVSIATGLATAFAAAMLMNIFERKQEGKNSFFHVVELTEETEDPAIWGKNFPNQYDSYSKTVDQTRTRYGGSEAVPRTPTQADPRSVVAQSRLEEDPRLKLMWSGYAFSRDFREERGHAFMLIDQIYTERQKATAQPGTCINCHASTYVPMMKLGQGDLHRGFDLMNRMPYPEARKWVTHPVSCIDCHNPSTMQLRVTKPAFMNGIAALKKFQGIQNYDVNKKATHQEMRTFVCAQCHVEYFFKGSERTLTYPWSKGLKADEVLSFYQENKHKDWVHKETGAPMLKAQHPEFEMWSQGIHAKSGVSCTDCHMPYKREGAHKVTDHHVRSPLLSINRACQTCHRIPEAELRARVELIQGRTFELRNLAMDALMGLIHDLKEVRSKSVELTPWIERAHDYQRQAQFLLDFVEAENSTGFHAPQEAARLLGTSIDLSRKGQLQIRRRPER